MTNWTLGPAFTECDYGAVDMYVGNLYASNWVMGDFIQTGGSSGPTWSSGTLAPTTVCAVGSLYSRVGGVIGATLYVSRGAGLWLAVPGV